MKRVMIGLSVLVMAGACSDSKPGIALTMCSPDRSDLASNGPATKPTARDMAKVAQSRDISDTVREMSWQLCNARTNRWIDDDYFRRELTALREGAFRAYGLKTAAVASPPSEEDMSVCLTAAGDDRAKRETCTN